MKRLVFNCSLPRSGSELLQTVLNQHPEVYGSSTSPLLEFQFAARNNMNLPEVQSQDAQLMESAFISMCGSMAQGYYQPITDKPVVCDKNRGWSHYFEWVAKWQKSPKMVCMVRDPRAIIWSFEKAYRKNRHLPTGPDNPAELSGMTFGQRAQHWLETQPLGLSLLRLQDSIQRNIFQQIAYVRYEDLLTSPQEAMDGIGEHFGIEQHQYDFNNLEKSVVENSKVFGAFGDHSVRPKLDTSGVDAWRESMPVGVSQLIENQTNEFMRIFKYGDSVG